MDNTQYLKELAAAEKRNKQTELEQAKAAALKANEEEKTKALKTYDTQRKATSVNSQLGAKNFAEFLASRGQTNMGIAAQAEMSRNNTLNRDISTINTNEGQAVLDYGNKATDINTGYQNNLLNANNAIDQELRTNLYNERLRQQQEKARYSSRGGGGSKPSLPEGTTFAQNGTAYQVLNGKVVPINYAVKSTTTDTLTGKKTTQYVNQKQYDYNRQGYFLQPQANTITFGSGKKEKNYKQWYNQYTNSNYIIAYDVALPITGNEKNGKEVIINAATSGAITEKQYNYLKSKFGY